MIPQEGYPRTAAVSPRVQVTASTGSTNADVLAAVQVDPAGWPHLALLLTTDQRAGRGRLDRSWTAAPDTALAVSIVLDVGGVPSTARGWIPLLAGAAVREAVAAQLNGPHVSLKWPNDVLVDGDKISGILVQGVPGAPDTVVVGIGVNTRMDAALLPVPTATSFAVHGATCDDDRLVADIVSGLARMLDALTGARGDAATSGVLDAVQRVCSTVGSPVVVSMPDGTRLAGTATRLDTTGRLVLDVDGAETPVAAGDVTHVR